MKAVWSIEYDTENKFEKESLDVYQNAPELLLIIKTFKKWLSEKNDNRSTATINIETAITALENIAERHGILLDK